VAVAVGAVATIVLGIVPEPLLNLAHHAATQLFVR
jgi:NADH-quinone oxidoreductase subunit N